MKNIKTINKKTYSDTTFAGCGECRSSCQSACKTSCTVANQQCENKKRLNKDNNK
ncbi:MAG: six-cysteine peptide SCIFF [Clostridiales bacterium GWF2_38_85]|nr:MAG: six-cysteine peptide SCIFF [Clostridiales bacterium GWF2_38_85]HBL83752.1 six-cysteine peptide SCIFF [Clostridiales bacterium]